MEGWRPECKPSSAESPVFMLNIERTVFFLTIFPMRLPSIERDENSRPIGRTNPESQDNREREKLYDMFYIALILFR